MANDREGSNDGTVTLVVVGSDKVQAGLTLARTYSVIGGRFRQLRTGLRQGKTWLSKPATRNTDMHTQGSFYPMHITSIAMGDSFEPTYNTCMVANIFSIFILFSTVMELLLA